MKIMRKYSRFPLQTGEFSVNNLKLCSTEKSVNMLIHEC